MSTCMGRTVPEARTSRAQWLLRRQHSLPGGRGYCPKYPEISTIRCARSLANTLMEPLPAGTIARFDVTLASSAFSVATTGRVCPCGHNVRYPSEPVGTTVTLMTCAWALTGIPHTLALTATSGDVMATDPAGCRVSTTRQGATPYSDNPPVSIGAKYPLMSITRLVVLLANTSMAPLVPADTMAALAVIAPVGAFKLEASGRACPVGHAVRYPSEPLGTAAKFSE